MQSRIGTAAQLGQLLKRIRGLGRQAPLRQHRAALRQGPQPAGLAEAFQQFQRGHGLLGVACCIEDSRQGGVRPQVPGLPLDGLAVAVDRFGQSARGGQDVGPDQAGPGVVGQEFAHLIAHGHGLVGLRHACVESGYAFEGGGVGVFDRLADHVGENGIGFLDAASGGEQRCLVVEGPRPAGGGAGHLVQFDCRLVQMPCACQRLGAEEAGEVARVLRGVLPAGHATVRFGCRLILPAAIVQPPYRQVDLVAFGAGDGRQGGFHGVGLQGPAHDVG